MDISNELTIALAKPEHLSVHYQPIYCVKNSEIHSFESLVRWNHQTHGYISPDLFIPQSEKDGSIYALSLFVLHETCEMLKHHSDIKASINISPSLFKTDGFFSDLINTLKSYAIPTSRIEVEITENLTIEHLKYGKHHLDHFKNIGITVSMDDFGDGLANFVQLLNYPFDKIKVDKQLVQDVSRNSCKYSILKHLIKLSHDMGMQVTAEGVETIEDFKTLVGFKCDYIQGFLISKALPKKQFFDFLTHFSTRENFFYN
jgi:EAL domain-containing protein (putative c-di-GMP-specific phosphodiesterase class I)